MAKKTTLNIDQKIALAGVVIAAVAIVVTIAVPEFRLWLHLDTPTPTIPSFSGMIGDASGKERFFGFLMNHDRQIVQIDVNLSEEQAKDVETLGKGKFYIDLAYKDQQGFDEGGELCIDLSQGEKDFVFDSRPESLRVQSYMKINGTIGPQMGLFAILATPVPIESVPKQ